MKRTNSRLLSTVLLIALLACGSTWAQNSPQAVVQNFYNAWLKNEKSNNSQSEKVLAAQKGAFDANFYALIMQCWDLGKNAQQVEGYDFDPFFATQDSVYSFRLGKQKVSGAQASVPVYATGGREKAEGAERLILTAQLRQEKGRWVIVDLIYPKQADSKDPDSLAALSRQILGEYRKNHPKK